MIFSALALAGSLYINGTRIENPPVTTLTHVDVRFDADGNIWIDAPQYAVAVTESTRTEPPSTPAPAPSAIPASTWWLVVEDAGSTRQVVDIAINGAFVARVKSGEPQRLLDLAPFLQPGRNLAVFQAAASPGAVGSLKVYIGRGFDADGAIQINDPSVRFVRRQGEGEAGGTLSFSFDVR